MNRTDPDRLEDVLHGRSLVIASNRGPVAFDLDASGDPVASRGAGGLVTALTHVMGRTTGVWVASALTPADREMVRRQSDEHFDFPVDGETLRLRYLLFERDLFDRYYNRISNRVFWFLMHGIWNLALEPRFDHASRDDWEAYRVVNRRFAEVLAEESSGPGPKGPVMTQDYHLMLVAGFLREIVPDAFAYHFAHTPWATPDNMGALPTGVAREILEGMLASDLLGFQTTRWAMNFLRCCRDLLDANIDFDKGLVRHKERETVVRHYPISIDVEAVRSIAESDEARGYVSWLENLLQGRRLILRVDRMELTKNVVRGLRAFEEFLRTYPEWREKVVHVALVYPSRRALPEYRAYEAEVLDTCDRINANLGSDDWQPVMLFGDENYPRAIAALSLYDVLIVNPIADGMNLVSKEGPAVNQRDGVLVLSRNAGSWRELGAAALGVNPFDLAEMADALNAALTIDRDERKSRAALLREIVERNSPAKWVAHQLRDISRLHEIG